MAAFFLSSSLKNCVLGWWDDQKQSPQQFNRKIFQGRIIIFEEQQQPEERDK
jgi:hypothetical protein